MDRDPFSELVGIMRKQGGMNYVSPLYIGEVVNPKLDEIEINVGKLPLYKDDILLDKWIKDKHYKLGYTCSVNQCSGGVIGKVTVGDHGTCNVQCAKASGCPASCSKKSSIQYEDNSGDCKNCSVRCKQSVYYEDRFKKGDLVLLYKNSEDKYLIINKIDK